MLHFVNDLWIYKVKRAIIFPQQGSPCRLQTSQRFHPAAPRLQREEPGGRARPSQVKPLHTKLLWVCCHSFPPSLANFLQPRCGAHLLQQQQHRAFLRSSADTIFLLLFYTEALKAEQQMAVMLSLRFDNKGLEGLWLKAVEVQIKKKRAGAQTKRHHYGSIGPWKNLSRKLLGSRGGL